MNYFASDCFDKAVGSGQWAALTPKLILAVSGHHLFANDINSQGESRGHVEASGLCDDTHSGHGWEISLQQGFHSSMDLDWEQTGMRRVDLSKARPRERIDSSSSGNNVAQVFTYLLQLGFRATEATADI